MATQRVNMSEMVDEMKPVWEDFVVGLGYTQQQGQSFAQGYALELANLPMLEKLRALEQQHDRCMTAGFKTAGIDENQANERANKQ